MIVYFRYNQLLKQMYPLKCSKFKELKGYVITDKSLGKNYPVSLLLCVYVGVKLIGIKNYLHHEFSGQIGPHMSETAPTFYMLFGCLVELFSAE